MTWADFTTRVGAHFVIAIGRIGRHVRSMLPKPDSERTTRRSLFQSLVRSDSRMNEFQGKYWKMIYDAACRKGLSHHDAEDVAQEALVELLQKIRSGKFVYDPTRGKFRGFVERTALLRSLDFWKKYFRHPHPMIRREGQTSKSTTLIDRKADTSIPDYATEASLRVILDTALTRLKKKKDSKAFQIFEAHVLKGLPVKEVAHVYKVSSARVYLVKFRMSADLREEINGLIKSGY